MILQRAGYFPEGRLFDVVLTPGHCQNHCIPATRTKHKIGKTGGLRLLKVFKGAILAPEIASNWRMSVNSEQVRCPIL